MRRCEFAGGESNVSIFEMVEISGFNLNVVHNLIGLPVFNDNLMGS